MLGDFRFYVGEDLGVEFPENEFVVVLWGNLGFC